MKNNNNLSFTETKLGTTITYSLFKGRNMTESNRIEYKRQLTDSLEKEVVAFLNYKDGGVIYIGVDDSGNHYPIEDLDDTQLKIKDRIKNNIEPSTMGLFDVSVENDAVKIIVASGSEKPYYIRKNGMSEKGCFIRVGSSAEPMPKRAIDDLFSKRTRNSIGKIESPKTQLTFEQLKIYYQEKGKQLNDQFASNLELLTEEKKYNYAAYLLADNNGISIKVAKYSSLSKAELIENNEYGYCSIIKATKQVLDKLELENKTLAEITSKERIESRPYDPKALREAIINSIVHNDYSNERPPVFEIFPDRIEITSAGGLPYSFTKEEFLAGYSAPRNKELMRVFKDLDLVEQLGSGIPRILEKYDESIFTFTDNFLKTTFTTNLSPNLKLGDKLGNRLGDLNTTRQKIVKLMSDNPQITIAQLADNINISTTAIEKNIKYLQENGYIERQGTFGGKWIVKY
jgi:predicted HTH transcriptional regulator